MNGEAATVAPRLGRHHQKERGDEAETREAAASVEGDETVGGDGGRSRRSSNSGECGGGCKRRGGGSASSGEMREREGCPGGGFIGGGEARLG